MKLVEGFHLHLKLVFYRLLCQILLLSSLEMFLRVKELTVSMLVAVDIKLSALQLFIPQVSFVAALLQSASLSPTLHASATLLQVYQQQPSSLFLALFIQPIVHALLYEPHTLFSPSYSSSRVTWLQAVYLGILSFSIVRLPPALLLYQILLLDSYLVFKNFYYSLPEEKA